MKKISILILFLLLSFAFLGQIFFSNKMLYGGDIFSAYYQFWTYAKENIKANDLALWTPYIFSGEPFLASGHLHLFYPSALFFILLPLCLAFKLYFSIHLFLSGLLMYYFMRYLRVSRESSLLSGIVYMFNGWIITNIQAGHMEFFEVYAWLPLALLLLHKSVSEEKLHFWFLLSLVLGLQILGGHPQLVYLSFLCLFLFFIFLLQKKFGGKLSLKSLTFPVSAFVIAVILSFAVSSIHFFPLYELSKFSQRSGGLPFWLATSYSLPPWNLIGFIAPDFFGNPVTKNFWGSGSYHSFCVYLGILPFFLVLLSFCYLKKNRDFLFFAIILIFSILVSLGKYSPVYILFYFILPGFKFFRVPSEGILLLVFSGAVLTGFGFEQLLSNLDRDYLKQKKVFELTGILLLTIIFLALLTPHILRGLEGTALGIAKKYIDWYISRNIVKFPSEHYYNIAKEMYAGWLKGAEENIKLGNPAIYVPVLLVFLSTIYGLLISKKVFTTKILCILTFSFVLFDLWGFGRRFIYSTDIEPVIRIPEFVDFIRKDKDIFRILPLGYDRIFPTDNNPLIFRIQSVHGYHSLFLKHYAEYTVSANNWQPRGIYGWAAIVDPHTKLIDLLNVKYIITTQEIGSPCFKRVFESRETLSRHNRASDTWEWIPEQRVRVYENKNCLPRAFLVPRFRIISDGWETLNELKKEEFDFRKEIILSELPKEPISTGWKEIHNRGKVKIKDYEAERIRIVVESPEDAFLVLSELWYPGWKAIVDGEERRIYRADHILRAIWLEKGKHKVEFVYEPTYFKIGKIISIFAISVLVAGFVFTGSLMRKVFKTI